MAGQLPPSRTPPHVGRRIGRDRWFDRLDQSPSRNEHVRYGGAKAAVRDFIRSWIQDIKGTGIRINVLSPGAVDTESLRNALARAQGADQVQAGIERMGAGSPIGGIAQTSEIAKAVTFLASDDASFIHGVELFADGGLAQV